jgi:hypothetical protein
MKPIVDIDRWYLDKDGFVLAGAAAQALRDAGKSDLVPRYFNDLLSDAWTFEHAIEITKKYCTLKNQKGGAI